MLRGIPANGKTAHSLVPVGRVRAPRLSLALARVLAFCSSEAIDSSKYLPLLPSASSFVAWSLLRRRCLSWQLQTPLRSHRCAPDNRYRKQRVNASRGRKGWWHWRPQKGAAARVRAASSTRRILHSSLGGTLETAQDPGTGRRAILHQRRRRTCRFRELITQRAAWTG